MAWGLWRIPESRVRYLGSVRGKSILELGCGAARWSIALAKKGARPTGLDLSLTQLAHARRELRRARVQLPLVRGSAEAIPFDAGSFDLVFCDWGAMTFADPRRTVPECARVLRPGGILVFATASPIRLLTHHRAKDRQSRRLRREYFGMHRIEWEDSIEFQVPYGEWVDLFVRHGFVIERLVETQAPPGAKTPYLATADSVWGTRWPIECIWRVRKDGPGRSRGARSAVRRV
ncbi:MAG TPA: class I SAM-dependent methyltransferase [Thermoplasmata archaeon]|nr:class I SAM-dependent methyltransferase [Thermoplasmata archaeon]